MMNHPRPFFPFVTLGGFPMLPVGDESTSITTLYGIVKLHKWPSDIAMEELDNDFINAEPAITAMVEHTIFHPTSKDQSIGTSIIS